MSSLNQNQENYEPSFLPDSAVEHSDMFTNNEVRIRIDDTERLQN